MTIIKSVKGQETLVHKRNFQAILLVDKKITSYVTNDNPLNVPLACGNGKQT